MIKGKSSFARKKEMALRPPKKHLGKKNINSTLSRSRVRLQELRVVARLHYIFTPSKYRTMQWRSRDMYLQTFLSMPKLASASLDT